MSLPRNLDALIGSWAGPSRLYQPWLAAEEAILTSDSTATVVLVAGERFISIAYTWVYKAGPQDGLILLGCEKDLIQAVWIDSWHMSDRMMMCEGSTGTPGVISMRGSYAAPPGPDWHWRTEIHPGDDSFKIVMYNISPEGSESLAVEAEYTRRLPT